MIQLNKQEQRKIIKLYFDEVESCAVNRRQVAMDFGEWSELSLIDAEAREKKMRFVKQFEVQDEYTLE